MKKIFYLLFIFIFLVILSCNSSKEEISDIITVNFYVMRESEKKSDGWYIPTVAVDEQEVLATFTMKRGEQIDIDNEIKVAVESLIKDVTLYIPQSYGDGYESAGYFAYTPKFIGDETTWCTSEDGLPTEDNTIIFRDRKNNIEGTKILDNSGLEVLDLRCYYGREEKMKYKKTFKYISSFTKNGDEIVPTFAAINDTTGTQWQEVVGVPTGVGDTVNECVRINDNGYIDVGIVQYFGQGITVNDTTIYELLDGYDVEFLGWGIPDSKVKITDAMQLTKEETFVKLKEFYSEAEDESWYFPASDYEEKEWPSISSGKDVKVNYASKTTLTVDGAGDELKELGLFLKKQSYTFYPVYRIEKKST